MASNPKAIEIEDIPELIRIVEEVRNSHESRVLQRHGRDVAVIMPATPVANHGPGREKRPEDYEAFLRAAGSWKDVDIDEFIRQTYESRRILTRSPVEF